MLSLVILTTGIIVLAGLLGFIFNTFLFQYSRAQSSADALAVSLAGIINNGDRVGQINELEESSRELIFLSRQSFNQCQEQDVGVLAPLCNQLLDEARSGHAMLDSERSNQLVLISDEIRKSAADYNRRAATDFFSIPGLRTHQPKIERIDVGCLADVQSNVRNLGVLDDLDQFDHQSGYIQNVSQLFAGNINAKLPDPDNGFAFNISSLPAYVSNTCSPARNLNPGPFVRFATVFQRQSAAPAALTQIPSAVQVFCSMETDVGPQQNQRATFDLVSTGATNGAIAGYHNEDTSGR